MEHGAAKILAMLAQHGMADWSTRDVEGSGPLRRLLFQKPLQKDFFLEMLSFVGPDEIFDHELRLLAAEIEDIIGMVRSEERRAELDFILDHIGLRFAPPEPYIPVSIAAAALAPVVSGREEASSGNGNIDAIWRELAVFGPDQRERLVAAGLPRHLLNDLIRGMATLGLVEAVMWTSVYEIDAEDTDPATLAAGKEAGKDLIRDLLSGAED